MNIGYHDPFQSPLILNLYFLILPGLADLHYREMSLGDRDPIMWDNGTVKELVKKIQSVTPRRVQFEPN